MANTYTQIHIQTVFAVKHRSALIQKPWNIELYKYINSIIEKHGHRVLAMNGTSDHIHIMFGLRPTQSISALLQEIKTHSCLWINRKSLTRDKFEWQDGFGAFSYAKSQVPAVIRYIENQEEHHRKESFTEEYKNILRKSDIPFDQRYIFKEPT